MRSVMYLVLLLLSTKAFAIDPRLDWKTIETDHFYIHFADGYQLSANKVAQLAEQAHDKLSPQLNWTPVDKTHLIISDETDFSNGYAIPFPFNRSVLFLTPPDNFNTLEDFDDWLNLLITHEYVHILHLDKTLGAANGLRSIFGRHALLFPNVYQPAWLIEGLATYHETNNINHTGRGQSTLFKMMMRTEVANGIKPVSQANLSLRSWPMGTAYYLYGVHFFQFIEQQYGESAIDLLIENYSDNVIPFMINSNAEQIFKKDITELWQEFDIWLQQKYQPEIERIAQQGIVQGKALTNVGYFTGQVSYTSKGNVFYIKAGAFDHAALMKINQQDEHVAIADVHSSARIDVNQKKGVLLAQAEYCDLYNINYDLFILSPDNQKLKQITQCGRYRSAVWSPQNEGIIAVHISHSQSALHRLNNQGTKLEVLWQGKDDEIIGQLDGSPGDDVIVASVFRPGQGWNIERFDLVTKRWESITKDDFIDMQPTFNHDGSAIVFSSERNGTYNIYRYVLNQNKLQQLTNVVSGAFKPIQLNNDSALYYVGYNNNGYDIYALDNAQPLATEQFVINEGEPPTPLYAKHDLQEKDYSPWTSMAPQWWFPKIILDEDQTEFGFFTSGNDALGIHNYLLNVAYDAENEWFVGGLTYSYSNRLSIGFERSTDVVLDANSQFLTARIEDDLFITYAFPYRRIDYNWNLVIAAVSSQEKDGRTAPGFSFLDAEDNILGIAGVFNNTQNYIRSISKNDGRDVRLVAESSDVWDSDYSGEVYTLDWREFISLSGQHVLALRFAEGYGTASPEDFDLGGEEGDIDINAFFEIFNKPLIGRREYPLRGYKEGLPQLRGRRMQLASMEYRFPIALVERGIMAPPVGIIQWAGSVFMDSGATWDNGSSPDEYFTGVGAELHADINLFYGLNLKARLGFASGLDQQLGDDRLYFSLGAAF